MYEYTDKILNYLNKYYIREFRRIKSVLLFDSLNKLEKAVDTCYDRIYKETRKRYRQIGDYYYDQEDGYINYLWVDKFLNGFDPLTGYVFTNETDRKRARAFEEIASTFENDNKDLARIAGNKAVDKCMRIWARQAKQFADEITDAAVLDDLKAQGYQKVQWHSEEDARVCDICYERNNKIYDIDNIPPKPHINCRCWLTGIK